MLNKKSSALILRNHPVIGVFGSLFSTGMSTLQGLNPWLQFISIAVGIIVALLTALVKLEEYLRKRRQRKFEAYEKRVRRREREQLVNELSEISDKIEDENVGEIVDDLESNIRDN